jgi:putative colanic acid biosynthesis UDP-glucose lipid carrier transferase
MSIIPYLGILLISFLLAYLLRFGWVPLGTDYFVALLLGLLLSSVVLPATGALRNQFRLEWARKLRRLLAGWAVVMTSMLIIAAALKVTSVYSRIWFGYWALFGTVGLIVTELLGFFWLKLARRLGTSSRNLVLVGAGEAAMRVEERLKADKYREFNLLARFGEPWSDHPTGSIEELEEYIRRENVTDVWIAVTLESSRLLEAALEALKNSVVDVHIVPDLNQYRLLNQQVSEWNGLPVISLSGTPMAGTELLLKNVFDRTCAAFLIVILSPLLSLIYASIAVTSRGPVLFHQARHGFGGETIEVLKFRSMKLHDEEPGKVTQAVRNDSRVTWIGRILRRTSLDELPQLINVLKGDMSLVGPRPHALEHNEFYMKRVPRYMLRHKVKPGITGWAQINGLRGLTDVEEKMLLRIEHDLWYIQNWSLWLDLRILLRTPLAMVDRNAF